MGRAAGLAKNQLSALARLSDVPALASFYLAGGSAVAAHLGHRRSVDLDLFSREPADLDRVARGLREHIRTLEVVDRSDATLRARIEGVPVDLVSYPYRTLEPPRPGPQGFPTAGLRDLAAMKLVAIVRRGIRRDFWDLWAIHQAGVDLSRALAAYRRKFGRTEADAYAVIRALTFFADADAEPAFPRGLSARRWSTIQQFFRDQAPRLLRPRSRQRGAGR